MLYHLNYIAFHKGLRRLTARKTARHRAVKSRDVLSQFLHICMFAPLKYVCTHP